MNKFCGNPLSLLFLLTLGLASAMSEPACAQPGHARVVDVNVPDDCGDGTTWATAYRHLQDAIAFASNPNNGVTEIWVAAGTYYPDRSCLFPSGSGNHAASFIMFPGVTVFGGFNGTELDVLERDFITNVTTLSGDLQQDDTPMNPFNGQNSWHVLRFEGENPITNPTAAVDGFTITAGDANGPGPPGDPLDVENAGGGALLLGPGPLTEIGVPGPTFDNCRFVGNRSQTFGGAIAGRNIGANLTNCFFENNEALNLFDDGPLLYRGGGAVSLGGEVIAILCTFLKNTSHGGGGALEWIGLLPSPTQGVRLIDCKFLDNQADDNGGGALVLTSIGHIVNCLFAGNVSRGLFIRHGGGFFGILPVVNSTFVENEARDPNFMHPDPDIMGTAKGGGVFLTGVGGSIRNCIFWGNSA